MGVGFWPSHRPQQRSQERVAPEQRTCSSYATGCLAVESAPSAPPFRHSGGWRRPHCIIIMPGSNWAAAGSLRISWRGERTPHLPSPPRKRSPQEQLDLRPQAVLWAKGRPAFHADPDSQPVPWEARTERIRLERSAQAHIQCQKPIDTRPLPVIPTATPKRIPMAGGGGEPA